MPPEEQASADPRQVVARLDALQRDLERLRAELEWSNRLATMGTVCGMIAHEINNILTPVLGYATWALRHPDDASLTNRALRQAADGAARASRIASAVLAFVRNQPWEEDGDRTSVAAALDEALVCLGRQPERDGITLRAEIDPDLTARISPLALQQVLVNLLLNAREAMRPTGGRLTVRARAINPEAEGTASGSTWNGPGPAPAVLIEVEDEGPGIEPEQVETIFEPFFSQPTAGRSSHRVENVGRDQGTGRRGTGLGLAVCKRIVEAAGGRISARSRPGRGACFCIRLPAAHAAPATARSSLAGADRT